MEVTAVSGVGTGSKQQEMEQQTSSRPSERKTSIMGLSIEDFLDFLKKNDITRFHFVLDPSTQKLKSSHALLDPLADALSADTRDFDQHEALFFETCKNHQVLMAAFIHWTKRGQGHGGARLWSYRCVEDFLRDGLRLAKGMTQKNAMAYLWWGGGKGIITTTAALDLQDRKVRDEIFESYGSFLSSLKGLYYSAEDVAVGEDDLRAMFRKTRFMSCIPAELGGSGNPSMRTSMGIIRAIEATLAFKGLGDIEGKTFAIQGLGNIGYFTSQYLLERGAKTIFGCDIFESTVERAKKDFGTDKMKARVVARDDNSILFEDVDILCPSATGGSLNPLTIPHMKAKIICGGANNQLEDPIRDDKALFEAGITYVPDFVANRMGIVNCANEQYGQLEHDPFIEKHLGYEWEHSVFQTVTRVLKMSQESKTPTGQIASSLANTLAQEEHPIFGHRGWQIIKSITS